MDRLRIAVIGAGVQGQHYVRLLSQIKDVELVGILDRRIDWAKELAKKYATKFYPDPFELVGKIDAACVITPATTHFKIVHDLLDANIHVLVEKPLSDSLDNAEKLVLLSEEKKLILQVAYLERFNPAIRALFPEIKNPKFIVAERRSLFSLRASDTDIATDHMVHDLDLLHLLDDSEPVSVTARGIRAFTGHYDVVEASLEFSSGLQVVLLADRISIKKFGLFGVWDQNQYLSIDCDAYQAHRYKLSKRSEQMPFQNGDVFSSLDPAKHYARLFENKMDFEKYAFPASNQIEQTLLTFIASIREQKHLAPAASGKDALVSLRIVKRILEQLKRRVPA